MTSLSTRFLGQPRLTKPTFNRGIPSGSDVLNQHIMPPHDASGEGTSGGTARRLSSETYRIGLQTEVMPENNSGRYWRTRDLTLCELPAVVHRVFLIRLREIEIHRALQVRFGHLRRPLFVLADGNDDVAKIERIAGAQLRAPVGKN